MAVSALGVLFVVALALLALFVFRGIQQLEFDPEDARRRLGAGQIDNGPTNAYLIVGSDSREGWDGSSPLAGQRADVIMVGLIRQTGAPVLFSLPRDLWLPNPCEGRKTRINAALNGCGDKASGSELLAVMVEDFTGIAVDHLVATNLAGFTQVIDAVGGVSICNRHRVRIRQGPPAGPVLLPEGCLQANSRETLAWVRSRRTEIHVDGQWQRMPGVNDLTRTQRQQEVLLQLLGRIPSFTTFTHLVSFATGLDEAVRMSDELSIGSAARTAWSLRDVSPQTIRRFDLPVENHTTPGGAQVLLPAQPFRDVYEQELGEPAPGVRPPASSPN